MTHEAMNKLLSLTDFCWQHRIFQPGEDVKPFGIRWLHNLICYFERETAAQAVIYPAIIWLDSKPHDGFLEIRRDGSHAVRLAA